MKMTTKATAASDTRTTAAAGGDVIMRMTVKEETMVVEQMVLLIIAMLNMMIPMGLYGDAGRQQRGCQLIMSRCVGEWIGCPDLYSRRLSSHKY